MKRIVAKEFLLIVGCVVAVLLVALFGWVRNAWLNHRIAGKEAQSVEQTHILDSLRQRTVPVHLDFLDLFDSTFVRNNCAVFIASPFWTMDPFFTGTPNGPVLRRAEGDPFANFPLRVEPGTIIAPPFSDRQNPILEAARRHQTRLFPNQGDKRKILYDALIKDGYALGTFHEFCMKLENPDDVRALYDGITKEGYDVGSYADFDAKVGPSTKLNRRYLICIAKGLYAQGYLTSGQVKALGARCGSSEGDTKALEEQVRNAEAVAWRPPADAAEVYNPNAPESDVITWEAALKQRGVSEEAMNKTRALARNDTSVSAPLLIAVRGFLCDTAPNVELRAAFEHLERRHVLRCTFEDLLCTLQNQPVPPRQETFDALARQQHLVDGLRYEESSARANLWSESKQWAIVKWAAIVLLVLAYPLRLIVLGTLWALQTLRT